MTAKIEVRNVVKSFDDKIVLRDVDLVVNPHEVVCLIGSSGSGKSTLLNHLLGQKISITSRKPQTTRHQVLGIKTEDDYQIIFVDTPGLHRKAGKAMNRMMNRTAANALADADVILFVSDATSWTGEDDDVLNRLAQVQTPVVAVLNKVDKVHPKEKLLDALALMSAGNSVRMMTRCISGS